MKNFDATYKDSVAIVTCPHCCDAKIDKTCDAHSKEISEFISEKMGASLFSNLVPPSDVDLNSFRGNRDPYRKTTRKHPFRLSITGKVDAINEKKNKAFVLDLHTVSGSEDDVTIVKHSFNKDDSSLISGLMQKARKVGLSVGSRSGKACFPVIALIESCNDVVTEASQNNATAIQVEFNRERYADDKKAYLKKIGKAFDKSLVRSFKKEKR